MEEWKSVLDEDKKGKDRHYHKEDRREINLEVMMEMFYEADEEEVAELKQAMEMSDEEWDQMIVKLETDNMTEEDWLMVNICPSLVEPVMEKEACPLFTGGVPVNPSLSRS